MGRTLKIIIKPLCFTNKGTNMQIQEGPKVTQWKIHNVEFCSKCFPHIHSFNLPTKSMEEAVLSHFTGEEKAQRGKETCLHGSLVLHYFILPPSGLHCSLIYPVAWNRLWYLCHKSANATNQGLFYWLSRLKKEMKLQRHREVNARTSWEIWITPKTALDSRISR